MSIQTLDPLLFPLHGQRLIEASAGTGKTYTIAGLYLRLLLGHGDNGSAYSQALSVEQILVVTFTEAATQELRERIRNRIYQARLAFSQSKLGHFETDDFTQALLDDVEDHPRAAQLLLQAQRQMDDAAIYTIHGFCQRMLTQNAFESGSLFNHEFITDETALRERAVADFWRQEFYPLDKSLVYLVRQQWASPQKLLTDIESYLSGPLMAIIAPKMTEDLVLWHQQNQEKINKVKNDWLKCVGEIEALIKNSGVCKKTYKKNSVPNWLAQITDWALQQTQDYILPQNVERFSKSVLENKTAKGTVPTHKIFDDIECLIADVPNLKSMLQAHAIVQVRALLEKEKRRFAWLCFDDLLSQLALALQNDKQGILAQRIRTLYPIAMIDEFQDTDAQQYQIFSDIYQDNDDCGLIMIGDPKQAIYAFRGADIFTYIYARKKVKDHYNLSVNWRSSSAMINAVNRLFSFADAPFIYDSDIPFININFAPNADKKYWQWQGIKQTALTLWFDDKNGLQNKADYEEQMADSCAISIRDLLNDALQDKAHFCDKEGQKPICAGDIAILVRTGQQAEKIKKALAKQAIASVYLSNRNSVLQSYLALDLHRLLSAVLMPENERMMRAALASRLLGLNVNDIDQLNHDEKMWEKIVTEFCIYQKLWFTRGVLPMLLQMMQRRKVAERLLQEEEGERSLTDLLHLGELLQQASLQLDSHHALLRWLVDHIDKPNGNSEEQQVRLESERDLVQIVTIHKSKGLEYPLVYMPFACSYRETKTPFYHDNQYRCVLDLLKKEKAIELADKERLAEDLRLIYVGLTRAIYGCFIGISALQNGKKTKGDSGLHLSALGYLIQGGKILDEKGLLLALNCLIEGQADIKLCAPLALTQGTLNHKKDHLDALSARIFKGLIQRNWHLTSYSHLIKQGHASALPLLPSFDLDATGDLVYQDNQASDLIINDEAIPYSSIFQFPRGARPGTFLHTLFESVDFTKDMYSDEQQKIITHLLAVENYDQNWLPVLQELLTNVLTTYLNDDQICLAETDSMSRLTEMEFVMPIKALASGAVNLLIKKHDFLSAQAGDLNFETASGMLKGFIDLLFCWQGRYFVLDWKSNYLGDSPVDYNEQALNLAMIEHRYDFQYQIYTLALHRFLKQRLPDYDPQRHLGGVFYLFIRGIEPGTKQGIFFTQPSIELIDGLDQLFSDEQEIS